VWIISDEDMGDMITKILRPQDLEFTFAIIMPDLEQPWDIMNQCQKWMKVLKDAIFKISPQLELKKLD
jgi:dihydroorotase